MRHASISIGCLVALSIVLALAISKPQRVDAQGQGGPSVTVVNDPSNPVPVTGLVRDADNPARLAYQEASTASISPGSSLIGVFFTAPPAGKRLVIENASIEVRIPAGQLVTSARLITHLGGATSGIGHNLVVSNPGPGVFVAGQLVRLYEDRAPGINVTRSDSAGSGVAIASISGYLIDMQ